jgi:hypothetical protein
MSMLLPKDDDDNSPTASSIKGIFNVMHIPPDSVLQVTASQAF